MKVVLFLLVCCMQQSISNASLSALLGLNLECIDLKTLLKVTEIMCLEKRDDMELWKKIIECHRPMTDAIMIGLRWHNSRKLYYLEIPQDVVNINEFVVLRLSGEGQCQLGRTVASSKDVEDTIEDLFLLKCGIFKANWWQRVKTTTCIVFGKRDPYVMSQKQSIKKIKEEFGPDSICNIGKCIKALNIA